MCRRDPIDDPTDKLDLETFLVTTTNDMSDLTQGLKKLERVWTAKFPQRAQGGKRAIAGFRYQFQVYLLKLVEHWLTLSIQDRSNIESFYNAAETISDILHIETTGLIVATQVKLTLRSGTLSAALEEFLTIHSAAADGCPELLSVLRYKLLCSKAEISNIKSAVRNWADRRRTEVGSSADLIIEVLDIVSETTPENRLLTCLANDLKYFEPLNKVREWLGLLIDTDALPEVHKIIWNDLHSFWRGRSLKTASLYFWREDDMPPSVVEIGKILTGQRPSVRHLREGYFTQRPQVYGILEEALLDWVDNKIYENEKIPLFWIAGRSGTGKSAALLHMLARLFEIGHAPILWIGNHMSLIEPAIKFAVENELPGMTPIIGIDDPYMASVQEGAARYWNDVIASLHSVRQEEGEKRLPLIVVCGPSEQAEAFRSDYCEYINVFIAELPHATSGEIIALRHWYQTRTSSEAPDIGNENVLMVQLFFQWEKHESLMEFAQRLYKRLIAGDTSHDILTVVSRILALNRLYVGYPSGAVRLNLSPEQQDVLDHLEKDLHIGEREENGLQTYWLLHAHLANAIYLNWYSEKPSSFSHFLKEGIIDSLEFAEQPRDRVAPLWAITRILEFPSSDLSKRLDRTMACSLLVAIYKELSEKYEATLPQFLIPVWVQVACIVPDLHLQPSPIDIAIESIKPANINEKGLRLTCHKLLQHFDRVSEFHRRLSTDAIINLLANAKNWHDWMPVTENALSVLKDDRLLPLLMENLNQNIGNDRSTRLLHAALQTWPDSKYLIEQAVNSLQNAPSALTWGDIVQLIIEHDEGYIPDMVQHWFYAHRESQFICFALGKALRVQYACVEDIALEWARLWHLSTSANFVLEPLLRNRPNDFEIISWACEWLITGEGDKSFILETLIENDSDNSRIKTLAEGWLKDVDPNHASWAFVWKPRFKHDKDNEELKGLAIKWLKDVDPNHASWILVWKPLFKHDKDNEELKGLAIKWLKDVDLNHASWKFVWELLFEHDKDNEELKGLAIKWLKDVDLNHASWAFVWQPLFEHDKDNEELKGVAVKWLKDVDPNHASWAFVWKPLFKHDKDNEELKGLAIRWLKDVDPNHASWKFVWQPLFKHDKDNEELKGVAVKWLKDVDPNHAEWKFIWELLFKHDKDNEELKGLAIKWLKDVDLNHAGWKFVWELLFKHDKDNEELKGVAVKWLKDVDPNHAGWAFIWQLLFKHDNGNEELKGLAIKWFKDVDLNHASWAFVWQPLFEHDKDNEELKGLAIRWLKDVDPNHASWAFVWKPPFKHDNGNEELKGLAIKWFKDVDPNHAGWKFVWELLFNHNKGSKKLKVVAIKWLEDVDPNHASWKFVWELLFNHNKGSKKLKGLAIKWFKDVDPNHAGWKFVWELLFEHDKDNEELKGVAVKWLKDVDPNHGSWAFVWQPLFRHDNGNEELKGLAIKWFKDVDPNHASWAFVWQLLFRHDKGNEKVKGLAIKWFKDVDLNHASWAFVWQRLFKHDKDNEELKGVAIKWLKDVDLNHAGWKFVWELLFEHNKGNEELKGIAIKWLKDVEPNHASWNFVWHLVKDSGSDLPINI